MGEIEVGPELDTEIGRRVFGHRVVNPALLGPFAEPEDARSVWTIQATETGLLYQRLPSYSTDIAAATVVFEAMVERLGEGGISLSMEDARGHGHVYQVWLGVGDPSSASGPLPEAICRAALAAVSAAAPPA